MAATTASETKSTRSNAETGRSIVSNRGCDRLSIMVAGRIAAIGTPADVKRQHGVESIDELFVRLARPVLHESGESKGPV